MRDVNESSRNVATLVAELRQADDRARHIESVAVAACQGVRAEGHNRVLQQSFALLRYSQTHEHEMASQRSGAETMHNSIVRMQREEFNELVRRQREEVRVLRGEASNISTHLVAQLAAERTKCHEREMMGEFRGMPSPKS